MKILLFIPFLFMCSLVSGQTYNSDSIIGKPKKIGNLEIAQNDFPRKLYWYDIEKALTDLGNGWRLPTKDELNIMFLNKEKISGFANSRYWSSTDGGDNSAWGQGFESGNQKLANKFNNNYLVRAVRAF